jgi:uncharacterized protein involved in exopolysaccharide biosynthesis
METDEVNIKEMLMPYMYKWKWYVLTIIFSLVCAGLFLRYTTAKYTVETSILIKDESSGGSGAISEFTDLGFNFGGVKSKLENEIELLKSRTIITKVVKKLKANITYYDASNVVKWELYGNKRIKLNICNGDSSIYDKSAQFEIKIIDPATFQFTDLNTSVTSINSFGEKFNTSIGDIYITPSTTNFDDIKNEIYLINISTLDATVSSLQNGIIIEKAREKSSAIKLSMITNHIKKAQSILDALVEEHSKSAIDDENIVARNTLNFIDERLNYITEDLSDIDGNVSNFKVKNKYLISHLTHQFSLKINLLIKRRS